MTKVQQAFQCDGPRIPTSEQIGLAILRLIPSHLEVRAITIRGQPGGIIIETTHDGLEQEWWINNQMRLELKQPFGKEEK